MGGAASLAFTMFLLFLGQDVIDGHVDGDGRILVADRVRLHRLEGLLVRRNLTQRGIAGIVPERGGGPNGEGLRATGYGLPANR